MSSASAASALSLYCRPRAARPPSRAAAVLSIPNPGPSNPFPPRPRRPSPNPNYQVARSSSSGSSSSEYNLEEQRWLREEQRWLREEQRWLREERRWNQEREVLLQEIARLKLELGAVELRARRVEGREVVGLLEEEKLVIEESGVSVRPLVLDENKKLEEPPKVEESVGAKEETKKKTKKGSKALRMGAEGDDVKELQEALMRLGFYSGEEDMDYSSFSTGTDRAVKTWQASIGAKEDGVMTAELLAMLFYGKQVKGSGSGEDPIEKDGPNGAVIASVSEVSEIRQTIVRESDSEVEVSQQRVFLLGENRWEEPGRLVNDKNRVEKSKQGGSKGTQCMSCRGEGRLMCLECDGTGEPNIEPQFMEWVDGGTKCPYCEGLGYTICDVCNGKALV
ncbi:hypothetical protein MLD38_017914 [Melastoma candidum]|uniref:Uncharacterized protein n=1 Tax=Melastoma candidum TaxID=119954 RepID=A0ACB9QU35_9MYRT|nr:hypothetical protein MLD38_017914 [Melastoma candidum]